MKTEYMIKGYKLMTTYLTENRIKTQNRNFLRKLNRFYEKYKDEDFLEGDVELEYLLLEKEFFMNIVPPRTNDEMASLEFLKIITNEKLKGD